MNIYETIIKTMEEKRTDAMEMAKKAHEERKKKEKGTST